MIGPIIGLFLAMLFYGFLFIRENLMDRYIIKHQGKFSDLIDPGLRELL